MFASLCILGRQPSLGLAELESLYGSEKLQPVGHEAVLVDVDPCLLAFDRLGGSLKFCKLLTELPTTKWPEIEKFLIDVSPAHTERMPAGKMRLGLSLYGFDMPAQQIEASGLRLKKAIVKTGRSVRLVPNKESQISTAQAIHNQLTGPTGWELVFIKDGARTVIAQVVRVQDIASYTRRDRERPKRDAKVGMLPPKLAQIIINLAVGALPDEAKQSVCEIPPDMPIPTPHFAGIQILDPFCGTGVILQEASLMGYDVQGSDNDARMVEYTQQNLQWLLAQPESRVIIPPSNKIREYARVEVADATSHTWAKGITNVATEAYLGRPFTSLPAPGILQQTVNEVNTITKKFLQNLDGQLQPGTRLCLALPAWHINGHIHHLPLLDQISDMGYNRVRFVHAPTEKMVYHRPGQVVGRELVVLTKS